MEKQKLDGIIIEGIHYDVQQTKDEGLACESCDLRGCCQSIALDRLCFETLNEYECFKKTDEP